MKEENATSHVEFKPREYEYYLFSLVPSFWKDSDEFPYPDLPHPELKNYLESAWKYTRDAYRFLRDLPDTIVYPPIAYDPPETVVGRTIRDTVRKLAAANVPRIVWDHREGFLLCSSDEESKQWFIDFQALTEDLIFQHFASINDEPNMRELKQPELRNTSQLRRIGCRPIGIISTLEQFLAHDDTPENPLNS